MSGDCFANRPEMTAIGRRVRAYVAPVDRNSGTVVPFDPSAQGQFDLDEPPQPFLDLGWVENFQRRAMTKHEVLRSGPLAVAATQYRAQPEALVQFDFPAWGKLQLALAGGTQQMNVLATPQSSYPQGSGGIAKPAARLQDGSNMFNLVLLPGDIGQFAIGDMVAVDWDYTGNTGYIGSGAAGAYVQTALDAASHVDYIRRVTFNVSRVENKAPTELVLSQQLIGKATAGMGVQKVVAFVDREGSSFFQEWSALFVVPADSGGRICFYYPRLQVAEGASESRSDIAAPIFGSQVHASLRALPTVDPNDGETVLCYRSYFPEQSAAVY